PTATSPLLSSPTRRSSDLMPAADCRRARENRQSLFGKLRTRTRGAEVQRNNGAGGSSDIEGKAAMGSGERAGKRASFNGAAERKDRKSTRLNSSHVSISYA